MTRRAPRGFALLEVLIAFAIAVMALGLLFEAASNGGGAARGAGYYEEAVSRAKSRLAMVGRVAALSEGETQGEDGGLYRWRVRISPTAMAKPPGGTPPTSSHLTLYAIEVGIAWTVDRRQHEVVLHSQRLAISQGGSDG